MLEADEFFDYLAGAPDPTGGGGPPGPAAMAALNAVHDALGLGGGGGGGRGGDSMLHAVEEDAEHCRGCCATARSLRRGCAERKPRELATATAALRSEVRPRQSAQAFYIIGCE